MNNILLTYTTTKGYDTFLWFESIEEINDFIELNGELILCLIDCVDTTNSTEIALSELGD